MDFLLSAVDWADSFVKGFSAVVDEVSCFSAGCNDAGASAAVDC